MRGAVQFSGRAVKKTGGRTEKFVHRHASLISRQLLLQIADAAGSDDFPRIVTVVFNQRCVGNQPEQG